MARPPKIVSAVPKIHEYLDTLPSKIISANEMAEIFDKKKGEWDLAKNMKTWDFFEAISEYANIGNVLLEFRNFKSHMFFYKQTSVNAIASNISKKAYLSHYTSLALHGLTDQNSKITYVTKELNIKEYKKTVITQDAIDYAFRKDQRETNNITDFVPGMKIVLLERKFSNNLGVLTDFELDSNEEIKFTDIERTLIDITVRPNYSGGVYEVLNAFKRAKDRVSINRLSAMLKKLDYIYPYSQAIGFYLERSGVYSNNQISLMRKGPFTYNFYLSYNMIDIEYSKEWKIYYPKGM